MWFTDITQIRTGEGWLFAAVVLDAFNREVISWATAGQDNPRTVMRAFTEAIAIRRPPSGCLIHSDRGYQFTSHDWSTTAALHGLKVSIGARKSCYDNAAMESWFASFKNEEIYPNGQPFTRAEAANRLFRYIWTYKTKDCTQHSATKARYAETASTCRETRARPTPPRRALEPRWSNQLADGRLLCADITPWPTAPPTPQADVGRRLLRDGQRVTHRRGVDTDAIQPRSDVVREDQLIEGFRGHP